MSGVYRQVTSLRESKPDGSAFDGVRKALELPPGETIVLAELHGAGRIVRLWLTLPLLWQRHALNSVVVRMFWDGERSPSVEVPLGDLFGASFGSPRRVVSDSLVQTGGGYLCRLEMPFNDGARIELSNQSESAVRHLFFQIGYLQEEARGTTEATLHAQYRRCVAAERQPSVQVLEARGSGRFVGLHLSMENRSWWLKPPFAHAVLPLGFGLGLLEGWETIVVDGDTGAKLVGTGAEDYFSSGFYFKGAPFCTSTHGCTYRSFFAGRVSAYRFHEADAIPFTSSLSFTLDHGLRNRMAGVYVSTSFWYQFEPHAPFPSLPDVGVRRWRTPWRNPVQWLIILSLSVVLAALAVYAAALTVFS